MSSVTAGGGANATDATHSRTTGYEQLVAARALPELPELQQRKIPAVNLTGAHMPSASLASVHAAAAKSSAPPPSTNQSQSDTTVFPFSQHRQVVTPSDNIPDPSTKADRSSEEEGNRNSWADMSEDVPETTAGSLSSNRRPLSPPAFPILDQAWRSSTKFEQRELMARKSITAALTRMQDTEPEAITTAILQELWNDFMTIVKNKHSLIAWIHRLHKGSIPAKSSSSEGVQVALPGPVLIPSVVSATASGHDVLGYAGLPSVGAWCMRRPSSESASQAAGCSEVPSIQLNAMPADTVQHYYIGSLRSPVCSKPPSLDHGRPV